MRARVIHAFPARIFNANTSLRRSTTTLCRVGLGPRIMRSGAYMCAYVRRLAREFRAKLGQPAQPAYVPFLEPKLTKKCSIPSILVNLDLKSGKKLQFLCTAILKLEPAYLP